VVVVVVVVVVDFEGQALGLLSSKTRGRRVKLSVSLMAPPCSDSPPAAATASASRSPSGKELDMSRRSPLSTPEKVNVAGLVVAAAGILLQYLSGV
jgi:hypothetical protein